MAPARAGAIFSIAAGLPFLRTLAGALLAGDLVPGFRYDPDEPLRLADVTVYVPTRRAARVLRSEFVDALGGRSAILPVIRPLGETDEDSGFFDAAEPDTPELAEPLSGPARLIELARLVLAWRNALPAAILDVHSESPLVAPASPADAVWLARNLAELIDAVETEEVSWEALDRLDAADHALWWQMTLAFLRIASAFWPARLGELNRSSPAIRRNATLHAETERHRRRETDRPVIVAGSTGSIPATARLIQAVAQSANGAVVLPGLDLDMSDAEWELIACDPLSGGDSQEAASRGHPQYGLYRLLKQLGLARRDVLPIGTPSPDIAARNALLSRALLPAHATAGWNDTATAPDDAAAAAAFGTVTLLEAANEREEATAIAIALRLALDGSEDRQAALITPDRKLARRVAAELMRFGIEADDSAGTALLATPQGELLRLLLEATLRPGDPVPLAGLLKHPLLRLGLPADAVQRGARAVELLTLRGGTAEADVASLETLFDAAVERHAADRKPPEWRQSLSPDDIAAGRRVAEALGWAVEPLAGALFGRVASGRRLSRALPLGDWADRTGRTLEALAADADGNLATLWSGEAGDGLAGLLKAVMETDGAIDVDGPQWCDLLEALAAGQMIKPRAMRHPRVFIFGALESRLQHVDTVVIGGLNEGTWPGQTSNDAFLSRTMKIAIGLEPPERRIGQLGHDFQMAAASPNVVFSRSLRSGTAPTVASRWLQRLVAVVGDDVAAAMRRRGARLAAWAGMLDAAAPLAPAKRPEPRPPAALQPKSYSFSEVGRLRRDPYAVYAHRVLRLHPVAPFNLEPGVAERGTLYHRIVDRFVREEGQGGDPLLHVRTILAEEFEKAGLPPHVDAVWRPRFRAVADAFVRWHLARAGTVKRSLTEVPASLPLTVGEIRLTGIADRIDLLADGRADIIDYKTGSSPSLKVARTLLDPQLALEAAALAGGGFKGIDPCEPASLVYVRLKPGERFASERVDGEIRTAAGSTFKSALDLGVDARAELEKLLQRLTDGSLGFASRVVPEKERDYGGEYDHLARVAEWSTAEDGEEVEDG
ncbi:double-strand break repair protein AddB [Rhizobium sp. TRM95111]|uniref:double-strand break repair protein AddB n=1 Tax=Rhizobium alarense TaxID=2846851 RepID=UPI001F25B166|nr:double-strand break repair protein AddB [Rhizobium alarense]MCF3639931.1 double-strand break repair protein AddB [Rhizobium alarense]